MHHNAQITIPINRQKATFFWLIFYGAYIIYLAAGAGFASNAVQAASRTLLVHHVDVSESTEAFGLYDLASRVAALTGPLAVAFLTQFSGNQRIGIIRIILFLVTGMVFLRRVGGRHER